ncbi:MAG: hypothetical protein LBM75_02445 [Myxococcales bacterium]|jgi:hypothetical protein|nr:hypothetical protein [Myxococcales bacterium]
MKTSLFFASLLTPLSAPSFPPLDRFVQTQVQTQSIAETLNEYIGVLAPLLIVAIVGIVCYAIFSATRSEELQGAAKTECKGEIMVLMRKQIAGVTIQEFAQALKLTEGQIEFVLKEMMEDRQVYETEHRGRKVWRLHGIGEGGVWV